MTDIEKAKTMLTRLKNKLNFEDTDAQKKMDALNMAIKVLEQEPCDDAISRTDAIRVASGYCHWSNIPDELAKLPSVSTEETGRWIPVSEKLPEDGTYLVTVERTPDVPRIETKSFSKDLNKVDDYDFPEHKCGWYEYDSEYGYFEDTDVIAWQPLPQPYKAESEVEE